MFFFVILELITSKGVDFVLTLVLHLQEERIDPQRYYELREKDTIKFGNSRSVFYYNNLQVLKRDLESYCMLCLVFGDLECFFF